MLTWQQLDMTTTADHADQIADILYECGALSVSLKDAGDQPLFQLLPEETPLWSCTQITALFLEGTDLIFIIEEIKKDSRLTIQHFEISQLEEQDWVRQTQRSFPPQCFSEKLWVIPSWCDKQNYAGPQISIDPGLAFGTGTHATTALCLEWLAKHPPKNFTVIDYGCGSGILSLAALALGAKTVYAIDHDQQALEATRNNASLNNFKKNALHVFLPGELPKLKADLIIANILSQPLIELAPQIMALANRKATLLLSGILITETDSIARAYSTHFKVEAARVKEEWVQLILGPIVN